MSVQYFLFGFFSAFALFGALLGAAALLRGSRNQAKRMRGYLDLIPDLTPEQRAKVQEIRRTFLPRVEGIRQKLCLRRAELASALFEDPPERDTIYSIAGEILSHQSELEKEVIEHILEEQEILTPPQRQKFHEIIVEQFASGGLGVHDVRGMKT
jgi:Spy/CpxP family protein refolding chaperone